MRRKFIRRRWCRSILLVPMKIGGFFERMHRARAMVRMTAISCTNFDRDSAVGTSAGLTEAGPKIARSFPTGLP
jgi:hypothetical protein